jgi:hypothetical protein
VGGRIAVRQTDWFLARAHFERDKPIEIQVRRGQDRLHLSFTIGMPNWRTLSRGEIAFQATRAFVLLLAIVIALARPEQFEASLVALMFAMIAVAEAFPPTGWAASLRQLPVMLSILIALASVSCSRVLPRGTVARLHGLTPALVTCIRAAASYSWLARIGTAPRVSRVARANRDAIIRRHPR